jgi:uroporphyrinogen-III synthase
MLDGLNILMPESRELDLFAGMLEAQGAQVLRCPLVRISNLDDTTEIESWIEKAIAGTFSDIIWLTGEGLRRLIPVAAMMKRRDEFVSALARTRNITRGPKPAQALRELGLAPGLAARTPTSQGVLDTLASENLSGRAIGVQMYPGDGAMPLLAELHARGAKAWPIAPYRYASAAETADVAKIIRHLSEGHVGLVVFTATPQIDRLFQVAHETGLEKELSGGLARTPLAAIGPVVEAALRLRGFHAVLQPENNFHLKPLVRAILAWKTGGAQAGKKPAS